MSLFLEYWGLFLLGVLGCLCWLFLLGVLGCLCWLLAAYIHDHDSSKRR